MVFSSWERGGIRVALAILCCAADHAMVGDWPGADDQANSQFWLHECPADQIGSIILWERSGFSGRVGQGRVVVCECCVRNDIR